ncbi:MULTISPECIES: hypothetical protein [Loigolactobacillus]|nr:MULTISPECIES: hypothetical protein [Loigolactobacillus]
MAKKTEFEKLRNMLKEGARESPLLIFRATNKATGESFREVSNRRRFKDLEQMLATKYQLIVDNDELFVTDNVVRWAIAENKLHDQPEDPQNKQAFKEATNAVLRDHNLPINV